MNEQKTDQAAEQRVGDKPPPIRVGAQGIDAAAQQDARKAEAQRLAQLSRLPPFQMFIQEIEGGGADRPDSQQFALERALALANTARKTPVIEEYQAWHADKGLWPHETYDGRPR